MQALEQLLGQVGHEAVVGHLEDGGLGVLVDGDDDLAVLHPCEVLNGAGDAHGDIQPRRDHLARLPHLQVVRHIPRVHRGAARAHARAEQVTQLLEDREVFAFLHATATGDDDAGFGQVRSIALLRL
jgi:hypothetical protein